MALILIIYKKPIPPSNRTKSVLIKAIDSLSWLRTHSLFTVEQYAARMQNLFKLHTVTYTYILTGSTGLQTVYICLYG